VTDTKIDDARVDAYLARIGAERPARPDLAALRALQLAHLRTVPFENLSVHSGEPIRLDVDALFEKVVTRRRGGFCFELNGLFAALLSALGFRVTLLSGQVFQEEVPGPPQDHLALRVDLDEPWLVDVGFGRFSSLPLRLDSRAAQADPAGEFSVRAHGPDLDVLQDGTPQYRLDLHERRLSDFAPTCWWHATAPDGPFARAVMCSRVTEHGRDTLVGAQLIRTVRGERTEERLADDAAVIAAYRDLFGIELSEAPRKRA
jgi:N-hydroxyarylamine O-acetyltransferase